MNIAVVGAGYVGLVSAAGFVSAGHRVVCVDIDPRKVAAVNAGMSFLHEPGLDPLLARGVKNRTLSATGDVTIATRAAEAIFVCVDTSSAANGEINLRAVRDCASSLGASLRSRSEYTVVVVKSTVVPGTTEGLVGPLIWEASGKGARAIGLAVNPEFLREGQAVDDFLHPDRIVIGGIDEASLQIVRNVYAGFSAPVLTTNTRTAEVIKYTSNALLALLISFSNEIAAICEALPDVDVENVMRDLSLDHRLSPLVGGRRIQPGILQYLKAGCGFGGSCLPKDVRALSHYARSLGVEPNMLDATMRVNETRPQVLVQLAERELGTLQHSQIAVLGLAFKPGTRDLRESPAIPVIDQLTGRGARVRGYDPVALEGARSFWAENERVRICDSPEEACTGADAALLVTAWPEFADLDWSALREVMTHNVLVDGRRMLDPRRMEQAGFRYRAIGRGREAPTAHG